MSGWLWIFITIMGPLLLIGLIIWVYLRNRNRPPAEIERAERGARELRDELEREDARDQ